MIPDDLIDLMDREIAGEATDGERSELEARLARDPEARAYYADLRELGALLDQVGDVEPPAGLKHRVLHRIEARARSRSRPGSWGYSWRGIGNVFVLTRGEARGAGERRRRAMGGKRALFVAAALIVVVVLVGYFSYTRSPSTEEAAGTIGKVEKHRAEQISDKDVILGGQEGSETDAALADLLDDAATLRNVSAELDNASRLASNVQVDVRSLRDTITAVSQKLESQETRLDKRWADGLQTQLGVMKKDLESRSNTLDARTVETVRSEINAVEAALADRAGVRLPDTQRLQVQLGSAARELGMRSEALGAQALAGLQAELQSVQAALDNRAIALDEMAAKKIQAQLGSAQSALDARVQAAQKPTIRPYAMGCDDCLGAAVLQREVVATLRPQLGAMTADLGSQARLDPQALARIQASLVNARSQLDSHVSQIEQKTLQMMQAELGAMTLEHQTLAKMQQVLAACNNSLESRAQTIDRAMSSRIQAQIGSVARALDAHTLAVSQLLGSRMESQLGAMNRYLGNKALSLGPEAAATFQTYLGNLKASLENHAAALGSRQTESLRTELTMTTQQLESKTLR